MRVLLVTFTEYLPSALLQVLNPDLEYCAIVVDEPEVAKKMFANVPPLRDKIFPFYELKECVENNYYDFVLLIATFDFNEINADILRNLKEYGLPNEKFVEISFYPNFNFQVERALRYYKEHVQDFEMFATGASRIRHALIPKLFKRKLFNFGCDGEDIYYHYKIANEIMKLGGGQIKYALIGLANYTFQYDLSSTSAGNFRLPQYLTAFNDLHNFWMPLDEYKKIFRPEYLNLKLPIKSDMDCVSPLSASLNFIKREDRIFTRQRADAWNKKNYPETVKENVKILDDYLTLCEKNNVLPIIFLPPVTQGYMEYFNKQMHDEFYYLIREALKKHTSAIFFDGWKLESFSDYDFFDEHHLNLQGAVKFSMIFNNAIEKFVERLS